MTDSPVRRTIALAVLAVALSLLTNGYWSDVYRKCLLMCTLALSYSALFGMGGQVAMSHAAFFGLGAYCTTILSGTFAFPLPLAMLCTITLSAVLALVIALPVTRLEGFYLSLATLALAQIFIVALIQGGEFTGGSEGLFGYEAPSLLGVSLTGQSYKLVVVCVFTLTLASVERLDRSSFGLACKAVRDDPQAAAAMGINVAASRAILFCVSSTLAAFAGMFFAYADNFVNPAGFDLNNMFLIFFAVIVGGLGRHLGAVAGTAFLYLLPELLGDVVGRFHLLLYGILVVLIMLWQPQGMAGLFDRAVGYANRRQAGRRAGRLV